MQIKSLNIVSLELDHVLTLAHRIKFYLGFVVAALCLSEDKLHCKCFNCSYDIKRSLIRNEIELTQTNLFSELMLLFQSKVYSKNKIFNVHKDIFISLFCYLIMIDSQHAQWDLNKIENTLSGTFAG